MLNPNPSRTSRLQFSHPSRDPRPQSDIASFLDVLFYLLCGASVVPVCTLYAGIKQPERTETSPVNRSGMKCLTRVSLPAVSTFRTGGVAVRRCDGARSR